MKYHLYTNIVRKLSISQLLDLKVGTRQYGDGASAGKKQSKSAKVAETTSGSLGLRLGGMQVYQVPYPPTVLTGSPADQDPDVLGPPVYAAGSVSHKYGSGSGSIYHQAKKIRKTLISTVL
jgi:hypothetical protein